MNSFQQWLTQELNQRDLSYRQLARLAGISNALVSRVLSGNMPASADFCIKIATALEVSPVMLLRLAGHLPPDHPVKPDDSKTLQEIIELARNLPPAQQKQLLDYARFIYQNRE